MGIRILVGTEPGGDFEHACFWSSNTDVAFGPVFYQSGAPLHLSAGEVAEAFGKWVGWDRLAVMGDADLAAKKAEMEALLRRDPKEAGAEGGAAGRLAVADLRGTRSLARLEEALAKGDAEARSEAEWEAREDAWGRLSTDGAHPWVIVLAQEEAWEKGFSEGFKAALAEHVAEMDAAQKAQEQG